ncbi:MAG: HlyD family efflux transporter periplasmic adaptor subunit [Oceanicoccus sp.]
MNKHGNNLYRQEALDNANQHSFGSTLIAQPLSLRIVTLIVTIFMLLITIFLAYGEYARKVTVVGYLEPEGGITRVSSSKNGIAEKLLFRDGDFVEKDAPLLRVKVPFILANGEEAYQKIMQELRFQKEELRLAIQRARSKFQTDKQWHEVKLALLNKERKQIVSEQKLQKMQSNILEKQQHAIRELKESNFVSEYQLLEIEESHLQKQREQIQLSQRLTKIGLNIEGIKYSKSMLSDALHKDVQDARLRLSVLNQRITEISGQAEYLIKAPSSGRITALTIKEGGPIKAGERLLAIVPENSQLYAQLLIPSRAAGFIVQGQPVRIMYDSYPFQQFGTQAGAIVSVSNAVINPAENRGPAAANEPVFVAKVRLSKTSITAFGEEYPLQADMLLTADIVQAKRSILEWMLEPLYSLRGRT